MHFPAQLGSDAAAAASESETCRTERLAAARVPRVAILKADRLYGEALRRPAAAVWPQAEMVLCQTAAEVRTLCAQAPLDLLITGVTLADVDGLVFLGNVLARKWARRVLVATARKDQVLLEALFALPVDGIFDTQLEDGAALACALQAVAEGRRYESRSLRARLEALHAEGLRLELILSPLERLVLSVIGDGSDDQEAAERLAMGRHAVRKHREHIHRKLGITARSQLIAFAHEHGFIRFEHGRISRPLLDSLMVTCRKRKPRRLSQGGRVGGASSPKPPSE